jgi:hypothetical protein
MKLNRLLVGATVLAALVSPARANTCGVLWTDFQLAGLTQVQEQLKGGVSETYRVAARNEARFGQTLLDNNCVRDRAKFTNYLATTHELNAALGAVDY